MTHDDVSVPEPGADPLARFRTWRGFLFAALVMNGLFVWGMWGSVADPSIAAWVKAFSWFPFNVIATVLYYVFIKKLSVPGQPAAGSAFYTFLCLAMIAANWIAMLAA